MSKRNPGEGMLRALKERAAEPEMLALEDVPREIQRSWQRCAQHGVAPINARLPDRLSARELKVRAEGFERLIGGAAPVMHNLSRQIANTRSMVLLSDPEGLVLHSVGDDDFISRAERVALQPGVCWDEASKGTNAIGTAAVERTAVLVHGGQHYVQSNQFLTCSASPIFDGFGDLAGVLDISGDYRSYQEHTLALVRLGAQMIEERLFEEAARGFTLVRFHPQRAYLFSVAEGRAAFSESGRLVAINHVGRELLVAPSVGEEFERLFGFPYEQALIRSHGETGAVLACTLPRGTPIALVLRQSPARQGSVYPAAPATRHMTNAGTGEPGAALLEIGRHDERMAKVVERARRVLHAGIPLLIQGESGTGKEWLARSLHEHGKRAGRSFIAVNCAAIPDTLIESELFGYEEGAFTGARRRGSLGRIREADGGTLFLDEIGDMPLNLQARLLRILQDRAVTPLGSGRSYPVDIHVVCATHRKLRDLVSAGSFRDDLYYRLNGFTVSLPPLRERADLSQLVAALLRTEGDHGVQAEVSEEVIELFMRHPWPGNIRQLRNVVRTGLALMDETHRLDLHCLADDFLDEGSVSADLPMTLGVSGRAMERLAGGEVGSGKSADANKNRAPAAAISRQVDAEEDGPVEAPGSLQAVELLTVQTSLKRHKGNLSAAARELGISRNRLYRKLREFA